MTTVANAKPKMWRVWVMLIIPPLLILFLIFTVSMYFGFVSQGDPHVIGEGISASIPYVLVANHVILFLILLGVLRADGMTLGDVGWRLAEGQTWGREILIGLGAGLVFALVQQVILLPLTDWAQRTFGDVVAGGDVSTSIESALLVAFFGSVILAPLVEESLYRGYAITRLSQRYSVVWAVVISALFFGPLHWAQGIWPMLRTIVTGGVILSGMFLWRRNLIGAIIVHFVLNVAPYLLFALGVA